MIVLVILTGVVFDALGERGMVDKTVKAEFIHNFRSVEESVGMYERAMRMQEAIDKTSSRSRSLQSRAGSAGTILSRLPVSEQLTEDEKTAIPTLAETIKLLNDYG